MRLLNKSISEMTELLDFLGGNMKFRRALDYKYIPFSDIFVFEINKEINEENNTLEKCLVSVSEKVKKIYNKLYEEGFVKKIVFIVRTHSLINQNVIIRKKKLWGGEDLGWIDNGCTKTQNIDGIDKNGKFYYGLVELQDNDIFNALNYSRISKRAVLLFAEEDYINNLTVLPFDKIFNYQKCNINWEQSIDFFCNRNSFIIKVDGNYDDRDVSVDLFCNQHIAQNINKLKD